MGFEYDLGRVRTSVKGVECGAEKDGRNEMRGDVEKVPKRRMKSCGSGLINEIVRGGGGRGLGGDGDVVLLAHLGLVLDLHCASDGEEGPGGFHALGDPA